jgi:ABC-2 type transport system ATP-binding protein
MTTPATSRTSADPSGTPSPRASQLPAFAAAPANGTNPGEPGTAVVLDHLVKEYRRPKGGKFRAVDGISLQIRAGETYALLGPNGAGKSTTIEMMEGHRRPTSGSATVLGVNPYKAAASFRARIGVVLQEATDAGELKVAESLRALSAYYPAPRPVDEVIAAVGLETKAGARISSLSGGQRRRVDVALGLIGNPELLFLDEPTTGFDPEARRSFWELIRSLGSTGTTIVLTTHYLDEAEQLADRLGVITGGRLVAEGTPATLGGAGLRRPMVSWTDAAGDHEETTDSPAAVVHRISDGGRHEPANLQVRIPHLEDIYLQLLRQHNTDRTDAS